MGDAKRQATRREWQSRKRARPLKPPLDVIDLISGSDSEGEETSSSSDSVIFIGRKSSNDSASLSLAWRLQEEEISRFNHDNQGSNCAPGSALPFHEARCNPSVGYLHSSKEIRFQDPHALYLNSTGRTRLDSNLPTIQISDLTSGAPLSFLFTAGMYGLVAPQAFFAPYIPRSCAVTILSPYSLNNTPILPTEAWPYNTHYVKVDMNIYDENGCRLENKYGCQHAKLSLVRFAGYLRVFITSGNSEKSEWKGMGQVAWVMDMPRRSKLNRSRLLRVGDRVIVKNLQNARQYNGLSGTCLSCAEAPLFLVQIDAKHVKGNVKGQIKARPQYLELLHSDSAHPFAVSLARLLRHMFGKENASSLNMWLKAILEEYDFSICGDNIHLISSVPGVHQGPPFTADLQRNWDTNSSSSDSQIRYGIRRLHFLLKQSFPPGFFRKSSKPSAISNKLSSSRDNHNTGNNPTPISRSQADSVEGICSSISMYHWGLHGSLMKAFEGNDNLDWDKLKIFYPSAERVCRGKFSLPPFKQPSFINSGIFFSRKSFAKKFPLRGCDNPCSKHNNKSNCRPCLLHEFMPCRAQMGRATLPQHTKMFLRESTVDKYRGRGWIFVGSHNLSTSAWGSANLTKRQVRNRINSYELGILLVDVVISDFDAIIPWERRHFPFPKGMESLRYDTSAGQKPWNLR